MFNGLVTFIRRLDPAWDYAVGFQPYVNDFSMEHALGARPGPVDGAYEVTWAGGLAVLGAYKRKVDADRHLVEAKRRSRTVVRVIHYNMWRLILWAKRTAERWTRSMSDLDDIAG